MTNVLATALQSTDMLLIDTLHAFDFTFAPAEGLRIECMDGRDLKRWTFTPEQIAAATVQAEPHTWSIHDAHGEHQLVCVEAFTGREEDEVEQE